MYKVNQNFNLSVIQNKTKQKGRFFKKMKGKGKNIKNTQTFSTQFSLQAHYNYTHIIQV